MRLLDDERGQSVQVGAAILLGFVVIAITMYQVEVVSSQNAEVEFNHNQEVRQDMTELRNSISNAGSGGSSDSVSVQLGTQYPPRTIFVNPPPVHGQVRTERAGNISFGDDTVARDDYGGDAQALLDDDHPTSRIVYAPRYSEFDNAGVTTLEHSLAFNTFENDATTSLTPQQIVQNGSLQLTVLRGNLSEQGTQSVSIDPRTVSGPTDPIRIRNDSGGPVVIHLPTETPGAWNETLGTENGSNGARVSGYDGERVRVELQQSEYELRMALVGVGSGVSNPGTYDVRAASTSNNGSDSAYQIRWSNTQSDSSVSDCDASGCEEDYQVVVGTQSADFTAQTIPGGITGADVDFSFRDPDGVGVTEGSATDSQTSSGSATLELEDFENTGVVQAYVSSGGSSDEISIAVTSQAFVDVSITDTSTPVAQGRNLTVDVDATNTGTKSTTQTVRFDFDGSTVATRTVTLNDGETESLTFEYDTTGTSTGQHEISIASENTSTTRQVQVSDPDVPIFSISTFSPPDSAQQGESITSSVIIENTGGSSDDQTVELRLSQDFDNDRGVLLDDQAVSLAAGGSATIQLSGTVPESFQTGTQEIAVTTANDTDVRSIEIQEPGSIEGTVTGQYTGDPIEGISVTVYEAGTSNPVATTSTDSNGGYSVEVLGERSYDVEFDGSAAGYEQTREMGVSVSPETATTLDVQLRPFSVFASSPDYQIWEGIDSTFEVGGGSTDTVSFEVAITEQYYPENTYSEKTVVVNGTEFTLTQSAAESITNGNSIDLLDSSNYINVDQSALNAHRSSIQSASVVLSKNDQGGTLDVAVDTV